MVDESDWGPDHLRRVRFFYGLALGGLIAASGLAVIVFAVFKGSGFDWRVLGLGGALVLVGGVAGLPNQFMPIVSAILKKIPGKTTEIVEATDEAKLRVRRERNGPKTPKGPRKNP